ncbi:MAG: phage holin family protein [Gammaproteobacteria bacterium]|nr:phage holin family protein [Gammaproteobacteria bacterium]
MAHNDIGTARRDGGTTADFMDQPQFKEDQPVGTLLSTFAHELSTLVRQEAQLVKADLRESATDFKSGLGELAGGAIIAFAGCLVLLMAAVYGLALELPLWLSALIVGGAALLIGLIVLSRARKNLASRNLTPDHAVHSLRKDAQIAKRNLT